MATSTLLLPWWLMLLRDELIEHLPADYKKDFETRFEDYYKKVYIVDDVRLKLLLWLLIDKQCGVVRITTEDGKQAILKVAELVQRKLDDRMSNDNEEWWTAVGAALVANSVTWAFLTVVDVLGNNWAIEEALTVLAANGVHHKVIAEKLLDLMRTARKSPWRRWRDG